MAEVLDSEKSPGSGSRQTPHLALWVEQRCREESLSSRQMAAKSGVSHATISTIKNGARPSAATIVKLAKAFGNNGQYQRQALEDILLRLCGYKSEGTEVDVSEPLGRLMDKVSHFNESQLKIVEQFADFVAKSVAAHE